MKHVPHTPHNEADWRKAVDSVLKGKDFDKILTKLTDDNIKIMPLYRRSEPHFVKARSAQAPWSIAQIIDYHDNAQVLEDLQNGASALTLVMQGGIGARRGFALDNLDGLLDGVHLDLISVRVDGGSLATAQSLDKITKGKAVHIALGLDPLSKGEAVNAATMLSFRHLGTIFMADGRLISEAGGSEAQELAYVLACGVAYMRALEMAGVSLDEARYKISFLLSADQQQFLTMAKFRALRLLWANIEVACGLTSKPIDLHAETAWRMVTKTDASVNWLRNTVAVFSAALGGANHISVLAHTAAVGLSDAFARRMARNTQLVLAEESHLHMVSDPASGAGGIEALTQDLCEKAWGLFQQIEAKGGIEAASGWLLEQVEATWLHRNKAINNRKIPITGTTEFPNINDVLPQVQEALPNAVESKFLADSYRFSENFEKLFAAVRFKNTAIYLCNLGAVSDHSARNGFAKNALETGGFRTLSGDVKGFKAAKTPLVCLCGSDEAYGDAAQIVEKLRTNGAKNVYIAGKNPELVESLKLSGSFYMGQDVLKALEEMAGK